ncbi:TIGR02391 family protein [Streptomyces sp. NPDC006285]|uniref:TIGR02391 family protein n=1 Tax=Streptomyces sp. NPDC006285 TaxID=3364742 RepID=UPI0036C02D48
MKTDGMNRDWVIKEIEKFLRLSARLASSGGGWQYSGTTAEIVAAAYSVEKIADRLVPDWRSSIRKSPSSKWEQLHEAAQRAKTAVDRDSEIGEMLGDDAPRLSAGHLHPWIWDAARSLWQSGHYRDAVRIASVKVNAETQNKVGRSDLSETKLFNEVFSEKSPEPGKPRLRVVPDDGSPTFSSVHRGVRAFAEGCFAAIRNPASHTLQSDLPADHALEQLAAFSVLARWIDDAQLEK